jgi:hypothetical protein
VEKIGKIIASFGQLNRFWFSRYFVYEKIQTHNFFHRIIMIGRSIYVCRYHVYIGNFTEYFTGEGVMNHKEAQYVGQFLNGFFEGKGTLTYYSGDKYKGEWHGSIFCDVDKAGQWNKSKIC